VGWLLDDMAKNKPYTDWLAQSNEDWERADDLAKQLREALHEVR
jgi:hypothetical protein